MKITLVSNAIAYNLFTLMSAVDPNIGRSCRGLNVYIPGAAEEAANAGASVDIGQANAGLTDITQPELQPLTEGDNYNYPQDFKNSLSLTTRWIQGSVNNCVVTLNPLYA